MSTLATNGLARVSTRQGAPADRIRDALAASIEPHKFDRYFGRAARFTVDGGALRVDVANGALADWLRRRYATDLERAYRDALGEPPASVDLAVDASLADGATPDDEAAAAATANEAAVRRAADEQPGPIIGRIGAPAAVRPAPRRREHSLRRFEDFVVGPNSRLAYDAARRLAEPDPHAPLSAVFIHGACGLGKTHLLQAIAAHALRTTPGARVRYTTGEAFTNAFLAALHARRVDKFRDSFRRLDLLCIDDVRFIASKNATQTELQHTFDALDLDGARIAFASDEHPRRLDSFPESLVSRFMAGLVAHIEPPDLPTRIRILERLAERRAMTLEPAAARAIAERTTASVRDLEGALTRIEAFLRLERPDAPLHAGVITVERSFAPSGPIDRGPRKPIAVSAIVQAACATVGVDASDVLGRSRHQRVVLARSLAAYLSREMTTLSFPEIARALSRPNHSTIITACSRVAEQLRAEADSSDTPSPSLAELCDTVRRRVLEPAAS